MGRYETRQVGDMPLWMAYDNEGEKAAMFPGDAWAVVSGNKDNVETWVSKMNEDGMVFDPRILRIPGPDGKIIMARCIPDMEYPGITASVNDTDGAETAAAVLEWHAVRECYRACAWTEDDIEYGQDPSGDINLTKE